jgi:hypothetical protein
MLYVIRLFKKKKNKDFTRSSYFINNPNVVIIFSISNLCKEENKNWFPFDFGKETEFILL